jgi:hypothetical protein
VSPRQARREPLQQGRLIDALHTFHADWAWVAIVGNALAGLAALAAWRVPRLRGKWVFACTTAAEIALLVQVGTGAILVSSKRYTVPRFHMFYGFVGFITVGIAYSSRDSMRGRLEMFYGIIGLFLMGVGIRAVLQVQ